MLDESSDFYLSDSSSTTSSTIHTNHSNEENYVTTTTPGGNTVALLNNICSNTSEVVHPTVLSDDDFLQNFNQQVVQSLVMNGSITQQTNASISPVLTTLVATNNVPGNSTDTSFMSGSNLRSANNTGNSISSSSNNGIVGSSSVVVNSSSDTPTNNELVELGSLDNLDGKELIHGATGSDTTCSSSNGNNSSSNGVSSTNGGSHGSDGVKRKKPVGRRKLILSAREKTVRRLESNERERLRMHSLNEAFQVRYQDCESCILPYCTLKF